MMYSWKNKSPWSRPKKNTAIVPVIDLQWFATAEEEGRTEEPSELKLKKAREEGRIPKSQELTDALILLLCSLGLFFLAPWIFSSFIEVLRFYLDRCVQTDLTDPELVFELYRTIIKIVLPVSATAIVAGVASNLIQNKGFIFTTKTIEPKFSKVIPKFGQYLRKTLFSFEGTFNVVKSIAKVIIIFVVAFVIIKNDMPHIFTMLSSDLWTAIVHISKMVAKLLLSTAVIFLIISVPDYIVQRKQFMESMKMTKQEVKQEYKETEGDPLVKGRLRQYMHEMLSRNMPAAVAKSDVVITNPTHYAVAVQYDGATMQGPTVMAKGVDAMARRIKEIAKENNVPLVENRPLARALYAEVDVGEMVPENYYQALAVILANVYNMRGK